VENRREQILRHAKVVFARKGYHDTGVDDIIARARIARGTLYLYFNGKREVFGALLDRLMHELDDAVRAVELGAGKPAPLDQVRANVRRVLELLVRDPTNVRLLFHQAASLDNESREVLQRFYDRVLGMIEMSLKHGVTMGLARPCDVTIVSSCIFGMIREVVERLALHDAGRADLDAVAEEIVRFGLHGILRTRSDA